MALQRTKKVFDQIYEKLCLRDLPDETLEGLYKFPEYAKIACDAQILEVARGRIYYVPKQRRDEVHVVHPVTRESSLLRRYDKEVTGIKVDNLTYIIVVTVTNVHIHERSGNQYQHFTYYEDLLHLNPRTVAITPQLRYPLLVLPALNGNGTTIELWSIVQKKVAIVFKAHHCLIGCVCINRNGTLVASASVQGNVVKVFDIFGDLLFKYRRGFGTRTVVQSLAFSYDCKYLACCSKGESIYIYQVVDDNRKSFKKTLDRSLSNTAAAGRYLISLGESSAKPALSHFAAIEMPKEAEAVVKVHGFLPGDDSCLLMVSDGALESARIFEVDEEKGGVCKQKMHVVESRW